MSETQKPGTGGSVTDSISVLFHKAKDAFSNPVAQPKHKIQANSQNQRNLAVYAANQILDFLGSATSGLAPRNYEGITESTREGYHAYLITIKSHPKKRFGPMYIWVSLRPEAPVATSTPGARPTPAASAGSPPSNFDEDGVVVLEFMTNKGMTNDCFNLDHNKADIDIRHVSDGIIAIFNIFPDRTWFFTDADAAAHRILTTCACADRGLRAAACHACLLDRLEAVAGDDAPARGAI